MNSSPHALRKNKLLVLENNTFLLSFSWYFFVVREFIHLILTCFISFRVRFFSIRSYFFLLKAFFPFSLFFLLCNKNRSGPNGPIVSNLGNITFREGIFLCVQLDKLHFPIPDCTMWSDPIWSSNLYLWNGYQNCSDLLWEKIVLSDWEKLLKFKAEG